jgi:hypothetical protein
LRVNQQNRVNKCGDNNTKEEGERKRKVRVTKKKSSLKGFYHYRRAEERGGLKRRETNC